MEVDDKEVMLFSPDLTLGSAAGGIGCTAEAMASFHQFSTRTAASTATGNPVQFSIVEPLGVGVVQTIPIFGSGVVQIIPIFGSIATR